MHKIAKKVKHHAQNFDRSKLKRPQFLLFVFGFAIIGSYFIFQSLAAVNFVKVEAEIVAPTGNATRVPATNASGTGNNIVQFGAASLPISNPVNETTVSNAIYVATNGNDGNAGSDASPLRNIGTALDRGAGRTIYVKSGTYDVCGQNMPSGNGASAYTRLVGAPGNSSLPIMRCPTGYNAGAVFYTHNQNYIELKNLDIDCNNVVAGSVFMFSFNGSSFTDGGHDMKLIGDTIHGCGQSGFQGGRMDNVLLESNTIYDVAHETFFSGISMFYNLDWPGSNIEGNYRIVIRNNRIFNNVGQDFGAPTDGNCIIMDENNSLGYTGKTLIENNLCYNNYGPGFRVNASNNIDIINNTFYQNAISVTKTANPWEPIDNAPYDEIDIVRRGPGSLGDPAVRNVLVMNNIIHVRAGRHPFCWNNIFNSDMASLNIRFVNNMVSGQAATYSQDCPDMTQNGFGYSGNFYVPDSMLVNPVFNFGGDFRPQTGSPAINRGATGGPTFDFTYGARTGVPDIGAYEFR